MWTTVALEKRATFLEPGDYPSRDLIRDDTRWWHMEVSWNRASPKSSHFRFGCSIIKLTILGIFGVPPISICRLSRHYSGRGRLDLAWAGTVCGGSSINRYIDYRRLMVFGWKIYMIIYDKWSYMRWIWIWRWILTLTLIWRHWYDMIWWYAWGVWVGNDCRMDS